MSKKKATNETPGSKTIIDDRIVTVSLAPTKLLIRYK